MTNLQTNSSRLSPQRLRLLWFGLPAAAISLLALLLGALVLLPLWSALQADSKRLQELQDVQDQVVLMRQQIVSQDIIEQRSLAQKDKLVNLIIGSGDSTTFLAALDREAKTAGVQLDLYQPQAAPAPAGAPAPAPGTPAAKNARPDPLEAEGLQRVAMQILAKGSYPKLLALLERIEELNVLVEQNGLKLEITDAANTDPKRPKTVPPVSMTIGFSLYGRPAGSKTAPTPEPAVSGGVAPTPTANP
jgi:type IV pilus assembly protein PilO